MEIGKLIFALEETVAYLRHSQTSSSSSMSVEEIIRKLEAEIVKAKNAKLLDVVNLELLFAPTGAIQETSIDNGWGTKFLRLAEIVDDFIGG